NGGAIPLEEPGLRTLVSTAVASGTLRAKQEVRPADVFFISVPTPLHDDKSADLGHVRQAIQSIAPHLRAGNLVILESTAPPGTCEAVVTPMLEHSGLQVGVDLHLA